MYLIKSFFGNKAKIIEIDSGVVHDVFVPKNISKNNRLAVGDMVEIISTQDYKLIKHILPRKNYISKFKDKHVDKVIASNIDLCAITISGKRFLDSLDSLLLTITLNIINKIDSFIVINKLDLISKKDIPHYKSILDFLKLKYVFISCNTMENIDNLNNYLKKKTFILVGESGVGKSSIASILCGREIKIGDLSKIGQGRHTTTATEAILTINNGICIDTPGFQYLLINNLTIETVRDFFPGVSEFLGLCKFNDCLHIHDKGCCLKPDSMPKEIYESYCRIIKLIVKNE